MHDRLLSFLWLLWAALLFGGFALGHSPAEGRHRTPTGARMASSLALVVAAWVGASASGGARVALLAALGMTLGFVGDLFMAGLLRPRDERRVLGGIAAFGLGHIAYIAAIAMLGRQLGLTDGRAWEISLALWLLLGGVGWWLLAHRGQPRSAPRLAALPYTLLLASTAGTATGLALQAPAFFPLALGAGLFLLSDFLIAANLFRHITLPLHHDLVWLTYGPAQMLIVFSLARSL